MNLNKLSIILIVGFLALISGKSAGSVIQNGTSNANLTIEYVHLTNSTVSLKAQKAPVYCRTSSDCWRIAGPNSRCYGNACICDLGYLSVNAYCSRVVCNYNSDCYRYFYNTRCSSHRCTCDYHTHLDPYSQTCRFNGAGSSFSAISVGIFVILGAIVSVFNV